MYNAMPDPWYRSGAWRETMAEIHKKIRLRQPVNAEIAAGSFTLTELTSLAELVARGGIVKKSHWIVGVGRQAHALAPPLTAEVYVRWGLNKPQHVESFFAKHPRVKQCVACIDLDVSRRIVLAGFDLIKHRVEYPELPWGHR